MPSEKETFVSAYKNFLLALQKGEVPFAVRTKLARARGKFENMEGLTGKEYAEAVFRAHREAGLDP